MERVILILAFGVVLILPACSRFSTTEAAAPGVDVRPWIVFSKLGVARGHVTTIDATLMSGRNYSKQHSSDYLLRVSHVDGKKLSEAVIMPFSVEPESNAKLATGDFELYEMVHGRKTGS